MPRRITTTLLCLLLALLAWVPAADARAAGAEAAGGERLWRYLHRGPGDALPSLFRAELAAAKAAGEQVLLVFTADWCTPCKSIKHFLDESPAVRKAVHKGRILLIDVDEWRGPAHGLIPGVNPRKLPMLARVDYDGQLVRLAMGSELGLISPADTATNLGLLLAGKAPKRPAYLDDPAERSRLMQASAARDRERAAKQPPLEVHVRERPTDGEGSWVVDVTVRNSVGGRRWIAIPTQLDQPLKETPAVGGYRLMKFDEHVRATYIAFDGEPAFLALPMGSYGETTLRGLRLHGPAHASEFEAWELRLLQLDGKPAEFQRKLPYAVHVEQADAARALMDRPGALPVKLTPYKRHRAPLR